MHAAQLRCYRRHQGNSRFGSLSSWLAVSRTKGIVEHVPQPPCCTTGDFRLGFMSPLSVVSRQRCYLSFLYGRSLQSISIRECSQRHGTALWVSRA